jgi:hypothetical protein
MNRIRSAFGGGNYNTQLYNVMIVCFIPAILPILMRFSDSFRFQKGPWCVGESSSFNKTEVRGDMGDCPVSPVNKLQRQMRNAKCQTVHG